MVAAVRFGVTGVTTATATSTGTRTGTTEGAASSVMVVSPVDAGEAAGANGATVCVTAAVWGRCGAGALLTKTVMGSSATRTAPAIGVFEYVTLPCESTSLYIVVVPSDAAMQGKPARQQTT